jgi:hypothetical protein
METRGSTNIGMTVSRRKVLRFEMFSPRLIAVVNLHHYNVGRVVFLSQDIKWITPGS